MKIKKVLVFDIETAPILAYVWGLHDQNIGLNQIKQDSSILAWGAKWLGDLPSKVMYEDQRNAKDYSNDKKLLQNIWLLLDKADIVITQNGQEFDSKRLNARFIYWGMKQPSSYQHIDTLKLVKKQAAFTSNRLEYLTDKLCTKYKKISHKMFPGMELWKECLKGNKSAWEEMQRYNIQDVLSTEELYTKLKAWAPESLPKVYDITDMAHECGTCGQKDQMIEGKVRDSKKYKYRQHQCRKCGAWQKGEKLK